MSNTNTMKLIGIVLFVFGIIVAISAGAKMPAAQGEFPTTLGVFAFGLIVAIGANIVWHLSVRNEVKQMLSSTKDDDETNPITLLRETIPALEALKSKVSELEGMKLCEEIDLLQDKYVHPFTEKRKTFMDILGTGHGAEVLLMIAYAERMLNRTWSAQSDGYPHEAQNSLDDSIANYKKALAKMESYLN